MKEPLLADDAFLADLKRVDRRNHILDLWWLGQSGFLIQHANDWVLIDPYLSDSLTKKYAMTDKPHVRMTRQVIAPEHLNMARMILTTHNHTDHFDPDTLVPLMNAKPWKYIVVPAANLEVANARLQGALNNGGGELRGLNDGEKLGNGITAIAAAHESIERDEKGQCRFLGYVLQTGHWTIYHSGDTVLYDGLVERLKAFSIDVAILPINGRAPERRVAGNLTGREAAQLAKAIGARLVIPCHYDMFEFNTADPADEFIPECERIGQKYHVLMQGERWSSDNWTLGEE
jgi:L-ascorbate metabolism protein UlaG (beta-lactamase superfamily)